MSLPAKLDSPRDLAERMTRYTDVHAASGAVLRQDPVKMAALSDTFQAEGLKLDTYDCWSHQGRFKITTMPLHQTLQPTVSQCALDLVSQNLPTSSVSHYLHYSYALSASILVDDEIIECRVAEVPSFPPTYDEAFAMLTCKSPPKIDAKKTTPQTTRSVAPPQSATSDAPQLISQSEALLLLDNPRSLSTKFLYSYGGGIDQDSGQWRISGVSRADDGDEEYQVIFEDCGSHISATSGGLLSESVQM